MKIELGKTYRTRGGEVVKITADLRVSTASDLFYPFQASNGQTYTAQGTVWTRLPSELDLVEEVLCTAPSPVILATNANLNEDVAEEVAETEEVVFGERDVQNVWNTYTALLTQTYGTAAPEPNIESLIANYTKLLQET